MPNGDEERSKRPPRALHIPTEVCENIIDMLHSRRTRDTFENVATLHSCALVCRDWRVRSQRRLFYLVQLPNTASFRRLFTILDDSPHLRAYVFHVELTGYHLHSTTSIFSPFPVVFAGKLPNLFRIVVVHFSDDEKTRFPRTAHPESPNSKAKPLSYIPLHPRFPVFLSPFTAVSHLAFSRITFRTFSEFARMLHGLPNLDELTCNSVRWITPGGSYPGADFTTRPDWAAGKGTLPPFAPKLQSLKLFDVSLYVAERLICTRGPHLTWLTLTIPLSTDPEELASAGGGIDLSSCTGLEALGLFLTPKFSETEANSTKFIQDLLASWKPQHSDPFLTLLPHREELTTRHAFAEVLRGLGSTIDAWLLQTVEEPLLTGETETRDHHPAEYWLQVEMYEREAERHWWSDHLESCFPTWSKLGRLSFALNSRERTS